jgi:hypothetical protein
MNESSDLVVELNRHLRKVDRALGCDGDDVAGKRLRAQELWRDNDLVQQHDVVDVELGLLSSVPKRRCRFSSYIYTHAGTTSTGLHRDTVPSVVAEESTSRRHAGEVDRDRGPASRSNSGAQGRQRDVRASSIVASRLDREGKVRLRAGDVESQAGIVGKATLVVEGEPGVDASLDVGSRDATGTAGGCPNKKCQLYTHNRSHIMNVPSDVAAPRPVLPARREGADASSVNHLVGEGPGCEG